MSSFYKHLMAQAYKKYIILYICMYIYIYIYIYTYMYLNSGAPAYSASILFNIKYILLE